MNLIPSMPQSFLQILLVVFLAMFLYMNISDIHERDQLRTQHDLIVDTTDTLKIKEDSINAAIIRDRVIKKIEMINDDYHYGKIKISLNELNRKIDSLGDIQRDANYRISISSAALNRYYEKLSSYNIRRHKFFANFDWHSYFIYFMFFSFFLVLFIIGIKDLNDWKIVTLKRKELEKSIGYTFCQSCAKVFSPALLHGKEKDGTVNSGFCNDCYDEGEFKNPKLTAEEVIANIMAYNPKDKTISKRVMKMVRWNQNPYVDIN